MNCMGHQNNTLSHANSMRIGIADGPEKCHGMGAENGLYSVIAKAGCALPYLLDMRERGCIREKTVGILNPPGYFRFF